MTASAPRRHNPLRFVRRKYQVYDRRHLQQLRQLDRIPARERVAMEAVSAVLPFRVNNYLIDELIDWDRVPDDPIYQLTFPQAGMLEADDFATMYDLVAGGAPEEEIRIAARTIQARLNPHPAGQMDLNVPRVGGKTLDGMQHKYRETVLFFPAAGQTCHAYCTYCFRWAQFVGVDDIKFASREADDLVGYLRRHPEVSSVLFTGGDPMVMKAQVLRRYLEPLLDPSLDHLHSIRIGTKAPAYWPYRFVSDPDADELLALFDEIEAAGRHLTIMAHYSHPIELETGIAQEAVRRIRSTGAAIRCQAPLIRYVNDDPAVWSELWRRQVRLGAVPYYMFVERDTGARNYFEVPLVRAVEIFTDAYRQVSGLGRTVRGPSMSTTPGKVLIDGVATINGEQVFVLQFLQARNPEWVGRPFFAAFDPDASWFSELEPAFGDERFFFEDEAFPRFDRGFRGAAVGEF